MTLQEQAVDPASAKVKDGRPQQYRAARPFGASQGRGSLVGAGITCPPRSPANMWQGR